ncbi:structural protein [Photobacterium sp. CCB-ST2H9]|uniref:structural protein n=1 Tax=Photobacterium sp. CCB-ST2H9 TaxID=2912855 RepID=UPI0020C6FB14|nr:structural protein [Photobacterium sp. CCB-ST2H9]UTM58287.1 structural protein [Photobacterium sp. CCB-ST2H9]
MILSLILLGMGTMTFYKPRGIRNNNPGNIEDNGTAWQGRVGSDGRFVIFDSPQNGIRALARTLKTYRNRHGLTTVRGIINRWAPPVENDTTAYVNHVAGALGVSPDMSLSEAETMALVPLIIRHENGMQPYSDRVLKAGIQAA